MLPPRRPHSKSANLYGQFYETTIKHTTNEKRAIKGQNLMALKEYIVKSKN
jgi:hypothetical protein